MMLRRMAQGIFFRGVSCLNIFVFVLCSVACPSAARAQSPVAGIPVTLVAATEKYDPSIIKGLVVHPEAPLRLDFIVDRGDFEKKEEGRGKMEEPKRLIKYFLAALTVPENEMWVNLSPYEKDRIIPDGLGQTEMGRGLLEQDYLLKRFVASLMYPDGRFGKEFWKKIYAKAYEHFGTTDIPVDSFNKVWIVPDTATVYQHNNGVFVVARHLKVMLESDYLAQNAGEVHEPPLQPAIGDTGTVAVGAIHESPPDGARGLRSRIHVVGEVQEPPRGEDILKQVMRSVIIPEIEREVNEGRNFAELRQMVNAMILAFWFKQNLKKTLLGAAYVDRNRVKGVDHAIPRMKEALYAQYLESFKKGVYNFIKEEQDAQTGDVIPRKYFSGGIVAPTHLDQVSSFEQLAAIPVSVRVALPGTDDAQVTVQLDGLDAFPAGSPAPAGAMAPVGALAPDPQAFGRSMRILQEASRELDSFLAMPGRMMRGKKITNEASLVMFLYSLEVLSEFGSRMADRDLVFQKIIEMAGHQPQMVQERRLPDIVKAIAFLFRNASAEEKAKAFAHLKGVVWDKVKAMDNINLQSRAVSGLVEAVAILFEKSPFNEKADASLFLGQEVRAFVQQRFSPPAGSKKKQLEKFQEIREGVLGNIFIMTGRLYQQAEPASREKAFEAIQGIALAAHKDVQDALLLQGTRAALNVSLLKLYGGASLQDKDSLVAQLSGEPGNYALAHASAFLEAISGMYIEHQGDPLEIIERMKQNALLPALKIQEEMARSITVSRVIRDMVLFANAALSGGEALHAAVANAISEVKAIMSSVEHPAYIQNAKSRLELEAKLLRNEALLHKGEKSAEERATAMKFFHDDTLEAIRYVRGDQDALSRLISGVAQAVVDLYKNAPDGEKQAALDFIEHEVMPLVDAIVPVVTRDENGKELVDERPRVRALSRIAIAAASLFVSSSDDARRHQVAERIEQKILSPLVALSRLNGDHLSRVAEVYRAMNALVWGQGQAEAFSWKGVVGAPANYDALLHHADSLSPEDRLQFFVSLGAFDSEGNLVARLLKDSTLKNSDKIAVIHGKVFYHKAFPLNMKMKVLREMSAEDIEYYAGKIAQNALTPQDILQFVQHTAVEPNIISWGEIAEMLSYASRDPLAHLHMIRHLLVVLRMKSHGGETAMHGVNIEQIPGMVRDELGKIFADERVVAYLYPELRALLRALPLDSFLINEIRIRVYKLFDEKLVPVKAGFLNAIRLVFHDSPSPEHLLVIRAYVNFLETGSAVYREEIDKLLEKYKDEFEEPIKVPADFIEQLGSHYDEMLGGAREVRALYEDLYGQQQAKAIVRTQLDPQAKTLLPPLIKSKVDALLAFMARDFQGVTARMAKSYKTATEYPVRALVTLVRQITDLRQAIQDEIRNKGTSGAARVYLLRLQNAVDPLAFGFMNLLREKWDELSDEDRRAVIIAGLKTELQDLAWESPEFRELSVVLAELETLPAGVSPLRQFAILTRIERGLNGIADQVGQRYQARVESYAKSISLEGQAVREFSANLIRESVLFSYSLMLEKAIDELAAKNNISRWNITRPGKATGRLVFIEKPDDHESFAAVTRDDILVMDHVSPDLDFPRVRGIITRVGVTSLSHLAIHAGESDPPTPWASPRRETYEAYAELARKMKDTPAVNRFTYTVSEAGVDLQQDLTREQAVSAGVVPAKIKKHHRPQLQPTAANVLTPHPRSPQEEPYSMGNSGAKSFKLWALSQMFPDGVPPHVTIPFSTFDRLVDGDPVLAQMIRVQLPGLTDRNEIDALLGQIRARIMALNFPQHVKDEINAMIAREIGDGVMVIERSSSSVEDGDESAGAGVYLSVVNLDRKDIFTDMLRVFASLYTWKALMERRNQDFDESLAKMNVTIQELKKIDPSKARQYGFVIHTRNPHSTEPNEVLIELVNGLGEALVSGELQFSGDAHQFVYNRETKVLRRLRFANKSNMLLPGQVMAVDYSKDPFSREDLPFAEGLKKVLEEAVRIEKDPVAGKNKPQDIEGVVIVDEKGFRRFYVQTRPQMGIEELDEKARAAKAGKPESAVTQVVVPAAKGVSRSLEDNPPVFHQGAVPQSHYDLPAKIFGGQGQANLVSLWRQAFASVLGEGRVLITPIGSLSYMFDDKGIRWQDVKDFDLNFYVTGITTDWEAWELEKAYLPAVKAKFIELAELAGLEVRTYPEGPFELMGTIGGETEKRAYEMKDANLRFLPLNRITDGRIEQREPDAYLPWVGYFGDPTALSALDMFLTVDRRMAPSQIERNAAAQYYFAYERARGEKDGGDVRKLKEICRLALVLGKDDLKKKALDVLDRYSLAAAEALALEVKALWDVLPDPRSPALQQQIAEQVRQSGARARALVISLQQHLASQRVAPNEDIFYTFHENGATDRMARTMADAILLAHLRNGRFFWVDWGFKGYRGQIAGFLVERLKEVYPGRESADLEAEAEKIMDTRVINFVHYYEPSMLEQWLERYSWLKAEADISHIDIIAAWLRDGHRLNPEDTMMVSHVDDGSIFGLFMLLASKGEHTPGLIDMLDQSARVREKVVGTPEYVERRVKGDLLPAQKMTFIAEGLMALLKPGKPLDEEGMKRVLLGDGNPEMAVFARLASAARQITMSQESADLKKAHKGRLEYLQSQYAKMQKALRGTRPVGQRSLTGMAYAVARKEGISDPDVIYAMAGNARIAVLYEELKDTEGRVAGWRYLSLGRSPLHQEVSLTKLIAVLNTMEESLRGTALEKGKSAHWRGRAHADAVLVGPKGIDLEKRDFSLIRPDVLLETLDTYLRHPDLKTQDPAQDVGGINLNARLLSMTIKGDTEISWAAFERSVQDLAIGGFSPRIIDIRPVADPAALVGF